MTRLEKIKKLNAHLLAEMPGLEVEEIADTLPEQRKLLRALMNVRPPLPLDENFLKLQDEILSAEVEERGVVKLSETADAGKNIKLWQGDITRLEVDAIVNAANSAMLGCFVPLHKCIDNAIHSAAGLQLRDACKKIMDAQGHSEKTGTAKITSAYNLPSKFVIHTVGPVYSGSPQDAKLLRNCYFNSLELAKKNNLHSIAFPGISTGIYGYPRTAAAKIALSTIQSWLIDNSKYSMEVTIVNFSKADFEIYQKLQGID